MKRINRHFSRQYQTFANGIGDAWKLNGRKMTDIRQRDIHFADATVGERRYFDAKVAGSTISKAILVPEGASVEQGDVFVIQGQRYYVEQKDRKDTAPPSWLLSLSKPPVTYTMEVDYYGTRDSGDQG